ncbi:MAG: hypothetical protein ACERK1_08215 [Anaerolineales bacterium]|jgi:hypothetical protein
MRLLYLTAEATPIVKIDYVVTVTGQIPCALSWLDQAVRLVLVSAIK